MKEEYFKQRLPNNFTLFDTQKIEEYLTDMSEKGFVLVGDLDNSQLKFQKTDANYRKYCILVDEEKADEQTLAEIQLNHWIEVKKIAARNFLNKYIFVIFENDDVQADDSSIRNHNTKVALSYQSQKNMLLTLLIMLIVIPLYILFLMKITSESLLLRRFLVSFTVGKTFYYFLVFRNFLMDQNKYVEKTLNTEVQQEIEKSDWDTYFKALKKKDRSFILADLFTFMLTFIIMYLSA